MNATPTVTTYPVTVPTTPTGATPATVYSAADGTGSGIVQIGSSTADTATDPAVWSVALPVGHPADVYTSTITTSVAAGP